MRHTLAVHIAVEIQARYIICGGSFDPNSLPNPAAGGIERVARMTSLFTDGNNIVTVIRGVMNKNEPKKSLPRTVWIFMQVYLQLILLADVHKSCHV